LSEFEESVVGRLVVRRSGRTQLVLGNVAFDISAGSTSSCLQVLACKLQAINDLYYSTLHLYLTLSVTIRVGQTIDSSCAMHSCRLGSRFPLYNLTIYSGVLHSQDMFSRLSLLSLTALHCSAADKTSILVDADKYCTSWLFFAIFSPGYFQRFGSD